MRPGARENRGAAAPVPSTAAGDCARRGRGPGVYASSLADSGYAVRLIDPVPLHIEQATELAHGRFVAELGDARHRSAPSSSADAVLLLGPLYHLPEAADRRAVLREARRVCRAGGQVIAAAISHWAGLFDLVDRGALDADQLRRWWSLVEETGGQRASDSPWFTTAYFHRTSELRQEFADAGLTDVQVVGVEGIGGLLPDQTERMADPGQREVLLEAAAITEGESELAGLSPHLLAVGRR